MNKFIKGKFGTVAIILVTVILAGIAIFTAYRLYQLRQQPVAPNVPSSFPKAEEIDSDLVGALPTVAASCHKTFTVVTASPTASASPTDGPGEPNSCGGTCGSNSNCKEGLYCYQGYCRNPSCPTDTDCECPSGGSSTSTPSPTLRATSTASPTEAALPQSGTNWPTVAGILVGILVILGSLMLAL